jgi:hypothetical protein
MSNDDKRFYRELKRHVKKTGNKKARLFFKKALDDHPEEAQWDEYDYGHDQSSALNGRDGKNRKRRKRGHNEGAAHGDEPGEEGPYHPSERDEAGGEVHGPDESLG